MALLGVGIACLAFGRNPDLFPNPRIPRFVPNSIGDKVLRGAFLLFGALMLLFFAGTAIRDVFLPWQVIEGKVESLYVDRSSRGLSTDYWIVIDGRRNKATNDVFSTLNIGDQVRAEIGSGSTTIFRVQQVPVKTR